MFKLSLNVLILLLCFYIHQLQAQGVKALKVQMLTNQLALISSPEDSLQIGLSQEVPPQPGGGSPFVLVSGKFFDCGDISDAKSMSVSLDKAKIGKCLSVLYHGKDSPSIAAWSRDFALKFGEAKDRRLVVIGLGTKTPIKDNAEELLFIGLDILGPRNFKVTGAFLAKNP